MIDLVKTIPLTWFKRTKLGRQITKAKIIARNRNDLGPSLSSVSWLETYRSTGIDPDGFIRSVYEEYVNSISTDDKAVSLELAYLLRFIVMKINPRLIVDLGSGFSSFLFRHYWMERAKSGDDCRVLSCDDNPYWLERTATFLQRHGFPDSGLLLWDRFLEEHGDARPDLILHDLGHMPRRIETLPQVLNLRTKQTILIVDDVHKTPMRAETLKQIRARDLRGYDLTRFTYDRFGRYAWMVTE